LVTTLIDRINPSTKDHESWIVQSALKLINIHNRAREFCEVLWLKGIDLLEISFGPWLSRIFSTSERQCLAWFLFRASLLEYLLDCPIIITIVASNWKQHVTLAQNGAKEAQQSVAFMLITLSKAENFNVQSLGR
jgi:hypothetical protein